MNFLNEEELKLKVLLPYIDSLGFSLEEITFEKSFSIKLGKKVIEKKQNVASGRLDILCKSRSRNLFVIEVKADDITISNDDIEQGVSYARLLEQIAPFVLVTNGKETIVVDTISKEVLNGKKIAPQSTFWRNGCVLSADQDIKYQYDAIKSFIGYSKDNLELFSRSQIEDRMITLKGSESELSKKYIPNLFLMNEQLIKTFISFVNSSYSAFGIIGESGVGKTNHICGLAENLSSNYITLFYNASSISKSFFEEILSDFNWAFSSEITEHELFRRINSLSSDISTKTIIFIDAIDESPYPYISISLSEMCLRIKDYPNIKLCISCKSGEWEKFLFERDVPTYLKQYLYPSLNAPGENQKEVESNIPGFVLERFQDDELERIDSLYRSVYHYKGNFIGAVKEECKLGFMFRIVAEVFQGKELPLEMDDIKLLEQYIEQKNNKMKLKGKTKQLLSILGKTLIESESITNNIIGKVNESTLKSKLGLSFFETIPEEYFSYNILTRNEDTNGNTWIGFYYSGLRDFIIAIYSYELNNSNKEFIEKINLLMNTSSGQNAIKWFVPKADNSQKKVMFDFKETQALLFVTEYERVIDQHFYLLKEKIDPYTKGRIGIVISDVETPFIDVYGFRPIEEGEKVVTKVERAAFKEGDPFFDVGVRLLTSFGKLLKEYNLKKIIWDHLTKQIKQIIAGQNLNENKNRGLQIELVLAVLYVYGEKLGLKKPIDNFLPRFNQILPVNFKEIQLLVSFFFAKYHFKELHIKKLIADGKIILYNNSYSYRESDLDYNEIERNANTAVVNGEIIPSANVRGDFPPFNFLYKLIQSLQNQGIENIDKPLLPSPDISLDMIERRIRELQFNSRFIPDIEIVQYSDNQMQEYAQLFFELLIEEYNTLVEYCFPKIKHLLPFYSAQPFVMTIECYNYKKPPHGWSLVYGYKKKVEGSNVVSVKVNPNESLFKKEDDFDEVHRLGLDKILSADGKPIVKYYNTEKANRLCVLREWVYDIIKSDVEHAFKTNTLLNI